MHYGTDVSLHDGRKPVWARERKARRALVANAGLTPRVYGMTKPDAEAHAKEVARLTGIQLEVFEHGYV